MGLIDWLLKLLIPDETPGAARSSGTTPAGPRSQARGSDAPSHGGTATMIADTTPWWAPPGVARTEPAEPVMTEISPDARALENTLVMHFDGHDLTMPPLPAITERVLAKLRDGKSSLKQVANEIADDQVVAAEIIRMANSVLYRGLHQATTLQAAVTRLGTKAVRTCVLNQSMRAAMFSKKGTDHDLAALVWYQSLAGSQIMRSLASLLNMDPEEASLIGLMHDIGNVIVLRFVEEHQKLAHHTIDVPTFDYLCHEAHQEFGELVAEAWKMPDTLKALAANHHTYPTQDDPLRKERLMVMLSDMISSMLGYGPPAQYALLKTQVMRDLGLDKRSAFKPFLYKLELRVDEALGSFGVIPGSPIGAQDEHVPGVLPAWLQQIRERRRTD